MKLAARSLILALLLWIAALHCSSSANGFVVVVNSDIPKSDIDEVRISVSREGEPAQTKAIPAPSFPLTLGVTSEPGDRVHVDVTGLRGGVAIVANSASATADDGDQRMLVLDLCRECEGLACNGNFVCVTATTCSAPGVDSTALPIWSDSPPAAACQAGDRPKRESSQTTAPPPVPVPTGDAGGVADAGGDSGPDATIDAGQPDAGFSCAICPAGAPCNEAAKTCAIASPPKCTTPLDVTGGGTFTGAGCTELPDTSKSCAVANWSYVAFVVNTLPPGKHLVGVAEAGGKEIRFSPYSGSFCAQSFGLNCASATSPFEIRSNTRFVLGQKGSVCDAYSLTLSLVDD